MGGAHGGDQEGLALHGLGAAQHVGVVFVPALDFGDGAVLADHHAVGHGFIVAVGNDDGVVTQVAQHGRHGAHAREDPFAGRQSVQNVGAGVEVFDFNVQTGFFIPAFFLGIPHQEGFVLVHPRGGHFHQFPGGHGGAGDAQNKHGGHCQGNPFFQHTRPPE